MHQPKYRHVLGLLAFLVLAFVTGCGTGQTAKVGTVEIEPREGAPDSGETTGATPGAAPERDEPPVRLQEWGMAPEIRSDTWLNSEPLQLADLRGKVVLLEFWTFGCINCQRVIPYLRDWHARYAGEDFIIVSVHYPEFGYEEVVENVQAALERLQIDYAVAIDNEGTIWRAYEQRYWPTLYLIDKTGQIRYKHIGEGAYEETEQAIRRLLVEPSS